MAGLALVIINFGTDNGKSSIILENNAVPFPPPIEQTISNLFFLNNSLIIFFAPIANIFKIFDGSFNFSIFFLILSNQ